MGHLREQSARQVLSPYARWRTASPSGDRGLESARQRHRTRPQRATGTNVRSLRELLRIVRSRLNRRALDREMDEEMTLHIDLHAEALRRTGLAPAEARRRALAEFGGVQRYREESR